MSKARAKARRQQKRGDRAATPRWIWGVALLVPLLIIAGFFYALSDRSGGATTSTETLPTATLDEALAATAEANAAEGNTAEDNVGTVENSTATDFLATTAPAATLPLGSADYCRRHPRFARQLGFNERSVLTTSSPSIKGIVMIQPAEANSPERVYQDPTWTDAGYLGHMTFDPVGNVYLFPSPRVSLIDNPPEQQNTLYFLDTDSAVMSPWITLTTDLAPSAANPYGLMGTTYDCDTKSLYAATVAGSTATDEVGKVVRIDVARATVVAELQGIDPFGLSVHNEAALASAAGTADDHQTVHKRLYFGTARAAEVYSVALDANGDFAGQPQLELALPDPALKPWRIVWDTNDDLIVRAMPFDFNLIATSERIEVPFRFRRDASGLWQLVEE